MYVCVYVHTYSMCVCGLCLLTGVLVLCDAVQYFSLHFPQSYGRDPRKCFKLTQPAVNGVCVGVRRGECFGLLGINGECDEHEAEWDHMSVVSGSNCNLCVCVRAQDISAHLSRSAMELCMLGFYCDVSGLYVMCHTLYA